MRRSVVLIVLFWAMGLNALAQTQGIMFEPTRSWKKIVEKARSENKLIFVDCYADWCGPCKQLASQVFTQKEVGDVFNSHFVNVQFNVEKDADGKVNVAKWGVASLPTLVFIDPKTEQVIGKLVGAGDAAWLVMGRKPCWILPSGWMYWQPGITQGSGSRHFFWSLLRLWGVRG